MRFVFASSILAACVVACSSAGESGDVVGQEGELREDGGDAGDGGDARSDAASGDGGASTFVDSRDGKKYRTVTIGTQTWFAENLAFETPSGSYCYDDDERNCTSDGRLYTFAVAKTACPAGSHLGSDAEWKTLETALGMKAGELDKEGYETIRGTNEGTKAKAADGLAMKPAGYRGGGMYDARGNRTYLWTSSTRGGDVWRRRVVAAEPTIYRFTNPPGDFAISVRCVVD
jgi:uncharacterized protein (TIGR02145 family)